MGQVPKFNTEYEDLMRVCLLCSTYYSKIPLYVPNMNTFGQKMMVKSDLEKKLNPPCEKLFCLLHEIAQIKNSKQKLSFLGMKGCQIKIMWCLYT